MNPTGSCGRRRSARRAFAVPDEMARGTGQAFLRAPG